MGQDVEKLQELIDQHDRIVFLVGPEFLQKV